MKESDDLRDILREELVLYRKILVAERTKTDLILKKDFRKFMDVTRYQEELMKEIAVKEDLREECFEIFGERYEKSEVTLRDICEVIDEEKKEELVRLGISLKSKIILLKEKTSLNKKLIQSLMEGVELTLKTGQISSYIKETKGEPFSPGFLDASA